MYGGVLRSALMGNRCFQIYKDSPTSHCMQSRMQQQRMLTAKVNERTTTSVVINMSPAINSKGGSAQ
eukprot:5417634-Amphidinium_carterae.1